MTFRGRTVVVFVLLSMFASSILTLTIVGSPVWTGIAEDENEGGNRSNSGVSVTQGLPAEDLKKINSTYYLIHNKFIEDVEKEKLVDAAIRGMLSALNDPHSTYLNKEESEVFNRSIEGSFSGIGAEVSLEEGKVTIVSPYKDSPAERAGLHAGDQILSVNGEKLEGKTLTEAVDKIRGPKGTQAKLMVMRPGVKEPIEIIVVRDDIPIETVYTEMLEGGIGKIEITQFSQLTAARFQEELTGLENDGMKGLIIDVRYNPGGVLPIVRQMAELFVPAGKALYQVADRTGTQETLSKGTGKAYPVVVLMNKGSASASEILAAALKESAGATLIGEKTYGKGSVQVPVELDDGSSVKLTIAKWLTPNGEWIHQKGIEPDLKVSQPDYFTAAPLPKDEALSREMNNEKVKNLQVILDGLGFKTDRKDGYFSEQTELALKSFQRLNKLSVTGKLNEETALKLEEQIVAEIRKPENDMQLNAAITHLQQMLAMKAGN